MMHFWVRSDVMPDGTYGVAIEGGPDRAFTLDRDGAVAYAVAVFTRATQAEHDTAVMRLLTERLSIPQKDVTQFLVQDIFPDRPDDSAVTRPMRFASAMARAKRPRPDAGQVIPMIAVFCDDVELGWITVEQLRAHAEAVLSALAAADLDAALVRALVGTVGIDEAKAQSVVSELCEFLSPSTEGDDA